MDAAAPPGQSFVQRAKAAVPGVALCIVVATAATFLARQHGAPVMLLALLIGMVLHPLSEGTAAQAGIDLTARTILRLAVMLLGARMSVSHAADLGWAGAGVLLVAVPATIGASLLLARWLRLPPHLGLLAGGATAICGASAALALAALLPGDRTTTRHALFVVVTVTSLSTLAMLLYPGLTGVLGLDDRLAGFFIGATIQDVAQVVGAGYAISDSAGETATLTKMVRVALLAPIVLAAGMILRRHGGGPGGGIVFPPFVIGFFVLAGLNSVGALPEAVLDTTNRVSQWSLVTAIAAIGLKTSLGALRSVGLRPLALMIANAAFITALVAAAVWAGR